ncbi:hypothetical protein BH10PSE19_BH10PSE19_00240 [soil metagenome]
MLRTSLDLTSFFWLPPKEALLVISFMYCNSHSMYECVVIMTNVINIGKLFIIEFQKIITFPTSRIEHKIKV